MIHYYIHQLIIKHLYFLLYKINMDMLNNLSNAATNLNNIGTNIHYYNAFTSADPNQKKLLMIEYFALINLFGIK